MKIILVMTLIIYPFIIFLTKNINQLQFITHKFLIFFSLVITFFILVKMFEVIIKNKINFLSELTLFLSYFWLLQFFYNDLKNLFIFIPNSNYISIFVIILISVLLLKLSQKKKFEQFIMLTIFLNITYSAIQSYSKKIKNEDVLISFERDFEKKTSQLHTSSFNNDKKDIFFILADGLTSFNNLEKYFNFDNSNNIKRLSKLGFKISKNSYSSYNTTYLTLTSIFSFDYMADENSKKYYERSKFYPNNLQKTDIKLINKLREHNYDFLFFPSKHFACNGSYKVKCVYGNDNLMLSVPLDYSVSAFFR